MKSRRNSVPPAADWSPGLAGGGKFARAWRVITRHKRRTKALRESEHRLRTLFESTSDGILVVNSAGRCVLVNENFRRMLRASRDQLIGAHYSEFIPIEQLARAERLFADAKNERHTPVELTLRAMDGTIVQLEWMSSSSYPPDLYLLLFRNDAERKRLQSVLQAQENWMTTLLTALPDTISRFDRDLRFLYISPTVEHRTGLPPEHFIGKTHFETGLPEDLSLHLRTGLRKVFETGLSHDIEFDFASADSGLRHLYGIGVPDFAADGTVSSALTIVRDITEQKRAEEALKKTQEQLRSLIEHASEALFIADAKGRLQEVNASTCALLGYCREGLLGKMFMDLHRPEAQARWEQVRTSVFAGATNVGEWELQRSDGTWIPVEMSTKVLPDGRWQAFGRDITERKQSEEALRQSESRYRTLAEALPQLVWTALPDGSYDYLSSQWVAYTGIPELQQLGLKWLDVVLYPDDRESTYNAWMASVADQVPYDLEYRLRSRDGTYRWFKSRGTPVRDAAGQIVKWFGTSTDVDDQKTTANALSSLNEGLRRANEDLEQFAFSASHDLQEPLRMVSMYGQLLKRKYSLALDAKANEYIGYMVEGTKRMEHLVGDLLAYARIPTTVDQAPPLIDANEALENAISDLRDWIEQSGALLIHSTLPEVRMNEVHLEKVFQNLIGNAIKYRSREKPEITVQADRHATGWCFSVKDNGIGIDSQYKDQIFAIFKRLHSFAEYAGTGVGLAICQRIIERYGGRIWVESELGKGATFFFTVPDVHTLNI